MRVSYDTTHDVLYIKFADTVEKVTSKNVDADITLDFDKDGKIAGIEILDASQHVDLTNLLPVHIDKKAAG
ncbi:MAG: DUF2283 domain-containing protein [Candidatus Aquicultor sp.]|nr:DUF2283 domain-containing protein [Candidatus Aquicultor sp.]